MTIQEDAVAGLIAVLRRLDVPYMIIGGMANLVWGEPRATLDVDVTVWREDRDVSPFVDAITGEFHALVDQPLTFIQDTRVLPVETARGARIDIIFGLLPFERAAIDRAIEVPMAGVRARVCTAEDLILMKIISDRERDVA